MYATLVDFEKAFGADDVVNDTDRMTQCLERATRLVDTYARSAGLTTPMTDVNALADVKGPCLDIARYFAWSDSNNEKIRQHYEDAISFLEKVATRKILLIPTGAPVATGGFANIRLIRG
ncbi:phage protein Gp36 family protein [Pseudomonas benzenivorans]|uniref:Phage protein Gp36 family protein n=1 Tax=Pseudomonas benzenivorans TaxID=556533 RepID=A0ABZ0PQU8_9PSED|nr:phage protein Gp36 family protein [Pseudomonas benzenivorans]WPC03466.1 phage protein Gp36 family protein [Pseudomonas benzenivorans]